MCIVALTEVLVLPVWLDQQRKAVGWMPLDPICVPIASTLLLRLFGRRDCSTCCDMSTTFSSLSTTSWSESPSSDEGRKSPSRYPVDCLGCGGGFFIRRDGPAASGLAFATSSLLFLQEGDTG